MIKVKNMNKDLTSKRTPLRNSNLANKPFRSPIPSLTPKTPVSKASQLIISSPVGNVKSSTPKRPTNSIDKSQIKKRRIDTEIYEESRKKKTPKSPSKNQLFNIKKRIRNKRQEIECLKVQLLCRKKHSKEDLQNDIRRWREGCQRALVQFQKDWNESNPEGVHYEMRRILNMLNIPEEVVKFPDESDLT